MDIDIDTPTTFNPLEVFPNVTKACIIKNDEIVPHPCGVYFQNIPQDPITKLSAIPYDIAEELNYLKIDFLHLGVYDNFKSREEIEELLKIDPDWNLLLVPSNVNKLFQISKHLDILLKIRPKSIEELADVIALIRPGKRELLNLYLVNKDMARRILYAKDENGFSFKKSHAIAYSLVIVLQLHLLNLGLL
jgi:DNA polymerase III alpha subunit